MTRDGYHRAQAAYDAAEPDDSEHVVCPVCGGSGAEPWHGDGGEVWVECRRCEGEGEVWLECQQCEVRASSPKLATTITLPDSTSVAVGTGADFGVVARSRVYQIRGGR